MRVVGIIAEYNPLHNGHIYHLERAKALSDADFCVVVLSGNSRQRGEAACTDKLSRATWRLRRRRPRFRAAERIRRGSPGGAVCRGRCSHPQRNRRGHRPCLWLRSAGSLHAVSNFGHHRDRTARLAGRRLCAPFAGKSYPRARFDALTEYGVPKNTLAAIAQPNNILAVEYLGAIRKYAKGIEPSPIERIGTGYHSEEIVGEFASATAIRKAIIEGRNEILLDHAELCRRAFAL